MRSGVGLPLALGLALTVGAGCGTTALDTARSLYYRGDFEGSAAALSEAKLAPNDQVLALMERGSAYQAAAAYEASITDWLTAGALANRMDYFSVSEQSASLVINDNVLTYRGAPYERVLLHAFAAKSFMALSNWEAAGVEARNIIRRLENRGDYPDDPYSRYVAAVSLELGNDPPSAAFQYAQAAKIATWGAVEPETGRLGPPGAFTNAPPVGAPAAPQPEAELICLVGIGRGPSSGRTAGGNWRWGQQPYVEIHAQGRLLGRSYTLNTTDALMQATHEVLKVREGVKTATRIVLKETAAELVAQQDEALGELLRLILYALETEDKRQWQTLPQWLGAARVPCPPDLEAFELVFKTGAGQEVERRRIEAPHGRRGRTFYTFTRAL